MNRLKIGYFADGPWAHKAIERLLSDGSIEIAFVCARSDNPDMVLKGIAEKNLITFLVNSDINSAAFMEQAHNFNCDLFVSMSFNQIFKAHIYNIPRLKTINCHAGKLPWYRGRNILNWALINDESEFGITVHYVDDGIDTGDIILQNCYPITDEDNYATLLERAYEGCATTLYDAIKSIQAGITDRIPQKFISELGSYCIARKQGDEHLNWNQTSREIFNFVRAIAHPGPQARSFLEDFEVKINQVQYIPKARNFKGIPGSILGVHRDGFVVKTSDSFVKVTQWGGNLRKLSTGDRLK